MRKVKIVKEYQVYSYEELSETAKENVREWYLSDETRPQMLEFMYVENLTELFGEHDLKIQFSLNSCQGDGVNIYGQVSAASILGVFEKDEGNRFDRYASILSEKERKTILAYANVCGDIKLPYNRQYCYSMADTIDVADEWLYCLKIESGYQNINIDALNRFQRVVKGIFRTLCQKYENMGYSYLYEVDEEELKDSCRENNWEFTKDGVLFSEEEE